MEKLLLKVEVFNFSFVVLKEGAGPGEGSGEKARAKKTSLRAEPVTPLISLAWQSSGFSLQHHINQAW